MNNYISNTNDFNDPETIERAKQLEPVLRAMRGLPNNYVLDPSLVKLLPRNDYDPRLDIELWDDK